MPDNSQARRVTIYAGPPIEELLDGFDGNRSGRLNSVAERYLLIVAAEIGRMDFSAAEWSAIFDVLNGCQIEAAGSPDWRLSWAAVADSPEVNAKWGVSHTSISARLQQLTDAGRAAVWEAAARFWATDGATVPGILAEFGVEFAEGVP